MIFILICNFKMDNYFTLRVIEGDRGVTYLTIGNLNEVVHLIFDPFIIDEIKTHFENWGEECHLAIKISLEYHNNRNYYNNLVELSTSSFNVSGEAAEIRDTLIYVNEHISKEDLKEIDKRYFRLDGEVSNSLVNG